MTRITLVLLLAATPLSAQQLPDSTLILARRLATEGQGDSARALVRSMLRRTSSTDSIYPSILFTAGVIAGDLDSARTYFRRVSIEYPNAPTADDALLRLAQIAFAANDFSGAARTARRIVLDFPLSNVRSDAAYWTARAELELGNLPDACRYLGAVQADTTADIELLNRVRYYAQRCTGVETQAAGDTAGVADSAATTTPSFAVQVAAVSNVAAADEIMRALGQAGHRPRVFRDTDGLWKVRVGQFTDRTGAQRLAAQIKDQLGGNPFVVEQR